MTIQNLTPSAHFVPTEFTYNLGTLKRGTKATVKAVINGATHRETKVGCGSCTEAQTTQKENNVEVEMTFKANTIGGFDKPVTVFMQDGQKVNFKLKGTVV